MTLAPALLLSGVAAAMMAAAPAAHAESAEAQLRFRLAHLVRGDLLLARARPLDGLGNTGHAAPDKRSAWTG